MIADEPRFAPNGNRLPERLPVGHRLVDTTKQHWLIGPPIGCGGFGDIYLTRQYKEDSKRLTQEQIIRESDTWTNVIKFEPFSGPLFAEINFYLRCARSDTIESYMQSKKLEHLGMPRFVGSGIYDPLRSDNPPPICKNTATTKSNTTTTTTTNNNNHLEPTPKRRAKAATNGVKKTNGALAANGPKPRRTAAGPKEKKYRFLVLQRFGDDIQKIWNRANRQFDMKSAFNIALKVIDTLEYIHSHGYVHADVKASNLLVERIDGPTTKSQNGEKPLTNGNSNHQDSPRTTNGTSEVVDTTSNTNTATKRTSRRTAAKPAAVKRELSKLNGNGVPSETQAKNNNNTNKSFIEAEDQIYLVDFGLVERFTSKDGTHRELVEDQRRANNGTVEFSSRDAHIGAFSRRSDLESLAYNLLYWVSGGRLPWCDVLKDHQLVEARKRWYMDNLEIFVNFCFDEDAQAIDPTSSTSSKTSKSSSKSTQSSSSTMCAALYDFLSYVSKLNFADEPDYYLLKSILSNALGSRAPRKRCSQSKKTTSPKPKFNPTPAMREILKKMKGIRQ